MTAKEAARKIAKKTGHVIEVWDQFGMYYRTSGVSPNPRCKKVKSNPRHGSSLIPAKIIIQGGKARVFVSQSVMRKINPHTGTGKWKKVGDELLLGDAQDQKRRILRADPAAKVEIRPSKRKGISYSWYAVWVQQSATMNPGGLHKYEVIVGNIGTVYSGNNFMQASAKYATYVKQSKSGVGRAGGESVTLMHDGEIRKEHEGTQGTDW